MIRIQGKRVLTVLAFVMAICVSFQLGLIWSTRSSFSDIVREQLPYLPVYNTRPCIIRTPIFDQIFHKQKFSEQKKKR